MLLGGSLGPWQALLMSPKGRNACRDGFVNLIISLNSIAPFGSIAPPALALLFCFSLIRRSLSILEISLLLESKFFKLLNHANF